MKLTKGKNTGRMAKTRGNLNAVGTRRSKPSTPKRVAGAAERKIRVDRNGLVRCRVCLCTELEPCAMGCGWLPGQPDLCDSCAAAAEMLLNWTEDAHTPSMAALRREVDLLQKHISYQHWAKEHKGRGRPE